MSARSSQEIEAWLLNHLRTRLGPEAQDVDAHLPFSYYGLDSLDAVELAAELEDWLQVPVTPDIAWDYPTAHAVATFLGAPQSGDVEADVEAQALEEEETFSALLSELEER